MASPQCILLQKDLLGQNAQFFWTVTWAPETADYPEAPTQFDFGDGNSSPSSPAADDADGDPPLHPRRSRANGDPWCIVDTQTDDADSGRAA